ncbi:MAG: adenosylcobalamin-dependent ribonucleoside-diphosphate reductase, partial [Sphingomonadales bacterium]
SARRGAMMATLRCDHPDILAFIAAKQRAGALRNFNLSVLVGDDFMAAVRADAPWPLVFPADAGSGPQPVVMRQWTGTDAPVPCRVHAELKARSLWEQLLRAAYDTAEPGVLFVDRINATNNLWYRERISATNPCGEVPLPSYGACVLGSLNLPRFVRDPFTPDARLDRAAVRRAARLGVRMLDNAIDSGRFPLPHQAEIARTTRRIGLGIMGLADALLMLGLRYDSREGRRWAGSAMRTICHAAYRTSIGLAAEKGSFPAFDRDRYLQGQFIRSLPADIRTGIARDGIRNSHLLAIAPTGSISLLAGAVSSGLEPIFAPSYRRTLRDAHGVERMFDVADRAISEWQSVAGRSPLPPAYVGASEIAAEDQLAMQAALQACVDNAISKTVTVAADLPFEGFRSVYDRAFDLGLKGCTVFRPGTVRGAVVSTARSCCHLVRD